MLPGVDTILVQLRTRQLLPESSFAAVDYDAVLAARDADGEFERDWLQALEALTSRWAAAVPAAASVVAVEMVRHEAFRATSRATAQHELASYVSDDFELIALASALGVSLQLVDGMWGAYAAGTFPPRPDRGG